MGNNYIKFFKRIGCLLVGLLAISSADAQVVTSDPVIPTESSGVTITFDATKGTAGLKGYTGDVYAHTGVILEGSSEWQYAPTWGDNAEKYKLTRVSMDLYTLEITPDIKQYYGVQEGEVVKQMAFVFRSADKSKEGKDTGGKDIFVDVADEALSVSFETPVSGSILEAGANVSVTINAIFNDVLELYVNGTKVTGNNSQSLTHELTNVNLDEYLLKAVAKKGEEQVEAEIKFFVRGNVVSEPMPKDLRRGVNVIDANTATVVLYAPNKDFVYLMGDFNNWEPSGSYLMKRDTNDPDYFWLTLTGLDNTKEYAYQFWFDKLKVADPYASKILDPWNDQYISSSIYPNLMPYPEGKTEEIVGVFTTADQSFDWEIQEFITPETQDLVIYELLIRDFTSNQDIKTVTDTLSYLKRLGINAIGLMPFNEFEGNDSWGYNPSFYFAADKAYGTVDNYKTFIDECHKAGIAVIMDMVLNHSYGQSPFARMYLGSDGKPMNNPWYNAEHNMKEPAAQWGYDFNHESEDTQELVDSICSYWMDEYKIDGFRFDFTKGFSNKEYGVGDWASAYDAGRIVTLKRMATEIWKRKNDAIVIFEHLADNSEEKELANHGNGILFWGNANHNYNEATMGYHEGNKSDLSWTSYQKRGWSAPRIVNYMESHDEERLMYKNFQYGNSNGDYDVSDLNTALKRMEAAATFFIPVPGPKMIWQFGELGFELSINRCTDGTVNDNCRLAQKPPKWEYQNNEQRRHLFEVYQKLIAMKKVEPVFSTNDFSMDVAGAAKRIELNASGSDVRIVGNFDVVAREVTPNFSTTGKWYSIFTQDSIQVADKNMTILFQPGEYAMYSQKKLSGFATNTSAGDDLEAGSLLHISPNPFNGTITVETQLSGSKQFELFSMTGMRVKQGVFNQNVLTENWNHLPLGQYILRISNNENVAISKLQKR